MIFEHGDIHHQAPEAQGQDLRVFRPERVKPPRNGEGFLLPAEFPAETPIDLELGCGVGFHPVRYARENPTRYLIAIEKTREKFEKFSGRVKNHPQARNLMPIHADAVAWVTHFLGNVRISKLFLLYPNPSLSNPAGRWFRMPFFGYLTGKLMPGGEVILATNLKQYADEARVFSTRVGLNCERYEVRRSQDPEWIPRTHFEKKYLARGDDCFDLLFRKVENHRQ